MRRNRLAFPTLLAATTLLLAACGDSRPPASLPGGPLTPTPKCAIDGEVRNGETGFDLRSLRLLQPAGRMTVTDAFPQGGALTPDGRFFWVLDASHGRNDVRIIEVATGCRIQQLLLPGTSGFMSFTPDGRRAYVSGLSKGNSQPLGPVKAEGGDAIHVYDVDLLLGTAQELEPILLPATTGGSARQNSFPTGNDGLPNFPYGVAVTPDGKTLAVAYMQADKLGIVDVASATVSTIDVGEYPHGVAIDPSGAFAYVSSNGDGLITKVNLATKASVATLGVGGARGNAYAHPGRMLMTPDGKTLYVAVINRDHVAEIDLASFTVKRLLSVERPEGIGTTPTSLALTPDGQTLAVATSGDDAIALVDLASGRISGRVPTASYPTDVAVTPDGRNLIWLAARGFGSGPSPGYIENFGGSEASPYGTYVLDIVFGRLGVLPYPNATELAALSKTADQQRVPVGVSTRNAPADTPIHGACDAAGRCASSDKIFYVFYVVRENRNYDIQLGCEPRGDGDCSLELLGDNGKKLADGSRDPTGGITPNLHALTREWPLLDRAFAASEVSDDGHMLTGGAYASDYMYREVHHNYAGRGRPFDVGIYPITFTPNYFLWDQAAKQGISFRLYGEGASGALPMGYDGRSSYVQVAANFDATYPTQASGGCVFFGQNVVREGIPPQLNPLCTFDSGLDRSRLAMSRIDIFNAKLQAQLVGCNALTAGTAACGVPRFNQLIMYNNHTQGTGAGQPTPQAMIADNDLATGQLVQLLSQSAIWPYTVIFVVEDDVQGGAEHVDTHRMPITVASPWVKRAPAGQLSEVISTQYNTLSVIRTLELILGLDPLSQHDALALPLYDLFISRNATPDTRPYTAIQPEQDLYAVNTPQAPNAALSAQLDWSSADRNPSLVMERILWQSIKGADSEPPAPKGLSPVEWERGNGLMRVWREGGDVKSFLKSMRGEADAD